MHRIVGVLLTTQRLSMVYFHPTVADAARPRRMGSDHVCALFQPVFLSRISHHLEASFEPEKDQRKMIHINPSTGPSNM